MSICSKCKAADPDLWISVTREIAYCEVADGRPICRSYGLPRCVARTHTRTQTRACARIRTGAGGDWSAGQPAALKAALVCRGISRTDRSRTVRVAKAWHARTNVYLLRQHRAAQRFIARNQGQREAIRFTRNIACRHRCLLAPACNISSEPNSFTLPLI